jgi:acyl dehydratase
MEYKMRGRYFEEFAPGDEFVSGGHTVCEAEVYAFAGLTGDCNPLHLNEVYAQTATVFKTRVAHGLFGVALAAGMVYQLGINEGTTMALLETAEQFKAPLFIGDTVHIAVRVVETKPTAKPDRGIVKMRVDLCNQNAELVTRQLQTVLIKRKP